MTDLTFAESQAIIKNFDQFVADVKGMEHGTVEIATGVVDICLEILHILEAFGIDVTLPCEFSTARVIRRYTTVDVITAGDILS